MGYTREYLTRPQMKKRPWGVHPIWRGIGCVLIVAVPILSYLGAVILVELNMEAAWVPSSVILMQTVFVPFIQIAVPHFYANLIVAGILILVGYAAVMVFYSLLYGVVGPPRLGPLDAEPIRRPPRQKYKTRR